MNMSSMSCVSFDAGIDDISLLTATVTSPSGHEEPCVLKKLPNNRMGNSIGSYFRLYISFEGGHMVPILLNKKWTCWL